MAGAGRERGVGRRVIIRAGRFGGEELGRGLSGSSFVVPARGEAEFDMLVTANLAGTLLKIVERARRDGGLPDELDYHLRGQVKLDRGAVRTVPFDEQGKLRIR